jgi:hypothetical protein
MDIFRIDEILIIFCNYLEIKESLVLSTCNRYLHKFVIAHHHIKKLIYKWHIPIKTSEKYYHSLKSLYIIDNDKARFINGNTWHIEYKEYKLNLPCVKKGNINYRPTEYGILMLHNMFTHLILEPFQDGIMKIDNWDIKTPFSYFEYNGKILLYLEEGKINLYKDGYVKSCNMSVYEIFKYGDKFIIMNQDYLYILNYHVEGLVERKIKSNFDSYLFTIINNDIIAYSNKNLYCTSLCQNDKLIWTQFHNIPINYNITHLTCAYQQFFIYILVNYVRPAKLVIYDYHNKKQIYEDDIRDIPLNLSTAGSSILLQWSDTIVAYNIKYL